MRFSRFNYLNTLTFAAPNPDVVKLVDTSDLGSDAVRYGGSSPSIRTKPPAPTGGFRSN